MAQFIFRRKQKSPKQQTKQKANFAFIDSQNLNLGTQKMGWKLDWRKFRKFLQDNYNVEKAFLFIGYLAENEDLYNQMFDAGYLVVLKPTVDMFAQSAETKKSSENHAGDEEVKKHPTKGNVDAELVLYAMKEQPNYDKAVIVSGDGDFYCLLEYLSEHKKLLHLLAPNWQYSSLLKPYDSYIVRLDQLKRQLSYRSFKQKNRVANKKQNS